MRRSLITLVLAVLVAVGLGGVAVATSSGSAITRPRLERSVTASFSQVYTQQAALLGHQGVTVASMDATTLCDKGPGLPQSGPGTSWNCLVAWKDPDVPMPPTGYGKFEVTVHSNGCYTVSSPSSLIGYATMTDARGRTVPNPAYEFDGCLDPRSDDTPTGVTFPSALTVTSTSAVPDRSGRVPVGLACAVGDGGCSGTIVGTSGGHPVGSARFTMTEQSTRNVVLDGPLPASAKDVTFTIQLDRGVAPPPPTVPVQR